ncbi:MAG: STAS domain-containing protein [bacterium]
MKKSFSYELVESGLGLEIEIQSLETTKNIQEFQQFIEEWFEAGVMFFRFDLSKARGMSSEGLAAVRDAMGFLHRMDAEVEFCGLNQRSRFLRSLMSQMGYFELFDEDGTRIILN